MKNIYDNNSIIDQETMFSNYNTTSTYNIDIRQSHTSKIESKDNSCDIKMSSMKYKDVNQDFVQNVNDPLIVVCGIAKFTDTYTTEEHSNYNGKNGGVDYPKIVVNDCINIKHTFHSICNFDIVFQSADNTINHLTGNIDTDTKQQEQEKEKTGTLFKTEWDDEEIDIFNDNVKQIVESDANNYDSLIYFMSYDSTWDINLSMLFSQFYNNQCKKLRRKPKIFFINGNRGKEMEYLVEINPNFSASKLKTSGTKSVDTLTHKQLTNCNTDSKNQGNNSHGSKLKINTNLSYLTEADCYYVYSNLNNFLCIVNQDMQMKGTYLIRSICNVFDNLKSQYYKHQPGFAVDWIINQIRVNMQLQIIADIDNGSKLTCQKSSVTMAACYYPQTQIMEDICTMYGTGKIVIKANQAKADPKVTKNGKFASKNRRSKNKIKQGVRNPLVVIVGIGKYDTNINADLIGVPTDYENTIKSCHYKRGYHIVYQRSNNGLKYLKNNHNKCGWNKQKFKIEWRSNQEIFDFNNKVLRIIHSNTLSNDTKYDGLLYFVSAHGERDSIILSNGIEYDINDIFDAFSTNNCPLLAKTPKIFIIDKCRGDFGVKLRFDTKSIGVDNVISQVSLNERKRLIKKQQSSIGVQSQKSGNTVNLTHKNEKNDHDHDSTIAETQNDSKNNHLQNSNGINIGGIEYLNLDINDKSMKTKDILKLIKYYNVINGDFYKIYSNTIGNATPDGGERGGYLIRSFTKVLNNDVIFLDKESDLKHLVNQTRYDIYQSTGKGYAQCVEERNTLLFPIKLL